MNLRKKFLEVCAGFCKTKFQGRDLYFKHISDFEQVALDEKESKWLKEMIDIGLPTRAEKLALANEARTWTTFEEELLEKKQKALTDFWQRKPPFKTIGQIDVYFEDLEVLKGEFDNFVAPRSKAIGECAEEDAHFEAYNQEISNSAFSDAAMTIPFFEDYDSIDGRAMNDIHVLYYDEVSSLKIDGFKPLKKICCQTFFANKFAISENPFYFLNKPLWQLTTFQTYMIGFGAKYLEILRNCSDAPDEYFEEPDKLECYSLMVKNIESDPKQKTGQDLWAEASKHNRPRHSAEPPL